METVNIISVLLIAFAARQLFDTKFLSAKPGLALLIPYLGAAAVIASNLFFRYRLNITNWSPLTTAGVFAGCTLLLGTLMALPIVVALMVNWRRKQKAAK